MKGSGNWLVGGLVLLTLTTSARPGSDAGQAQYVPWSGYWWPIRSASMMEPLRKYDAVTGRAAAAWEYRHKPPTGAARWWGYCHAWSAAAILEREPRESRIVPSVGGRTIAFGVGDLKGLLTAAHDGDPCNVYGRRFTGRPGDDPQDIHPDALWRCLRLYVKQRGVPLIIDASPGTQVWNYPVYAYQIDYRPLDSVRQLGRMKLLMADDNVSPGFVGTRVKAKSYLFTFQLADGALAVGSGRWVGASVRDHPDFAWYPLQARPKNPELSYRAVRRIVAGTGARDPDEPSDAPPPLPRELAEVAAGRLVPVSALELVSLLAAPEESGTGLRLAATPLEGDTVAVGSAYRVSGTADRDGYLYLFHLTPEGDVRLLFPLDGQDNRIVKEKPFDLGKVGTKVRLVVPEPQGRQWVRGIVTTRPLLLGPVETPEADAPTEMVGRRFRWEPDERLLVQEYLRAAREGRLTAARLREETGVEAGEWLGEFAHGTATLDVAATARDR